MDTTLDYLIDPRWLESDTQSDGTPLLEEQLERAFQEYRTTYAVPASGDEE